MNQQLDFSSIRKDNPLLVEQPKNILDETTILVKPKAGHVVFEINHVTEQVVLAETFKDANRPALTRIIKKKGCEYVCALNMKNAIKKFINRKK